MKSNVLSTRASISLLSLAYYLLVRTVCIGNIYTETVVVNRGTTAGTGFVTIELHLLLIEALDETMRRSSLVTLTAYVDDIAAETVTSETKLCAALVDVLRVITTWFTVMCLVFSTTNKFCCVSRMSIGRVLIRALSGLPVCYRHRVTSLDSGLGAGRRRNSRMTAARLAGFVRRCGHYRRLRRVGVHTDRLIHTGCTASLQFGQSMTSVSNTTLLQQHRTVVAVTVTSTAGGDLDLTLMLTDGGSRGRTDPTFEVRGCVYLP